MRSTGIHHVDLVVSSIERSLPFYRDLLGPLGYHRISEVEGERGETIWYFGGPGSSLGLRQAQSLGGLDRYRVGLH
nr:VOC family protein [Actinomycetota bacterium]